MDTTEGRLIALDAARGRACTGIGDADTVRIDPGMALVEPGEFHDVAPRHRCDERDRRILHRRQRTGGRTERHGTRIRCPQRAAALELRSGRTRARQPARLARCGRRAYRPRQRVGTHAPVDEARNLVFLPTSSPSPDFFGGRRHGDNRYANSVVALQADSGTVAWHFQIVHHDGWD